MRVVANDFRIEKNSDLEERRNFSIKEVRRERGLSRVSWAKNECPASSISLSPSSDCQRVNQAANIDDRQPHTRKF